MKINLSIDNQGQLDALALKYPESGIMQELVFMNEIERQAAIEMLERLPDD